MKLMQSLWFFLLLISFSSYSQVKFKPQLEGGAGFSQDNFFLFNFGLGIEKKIDINKSIETGIYYHNFEFNFPKNALGFYEAFIQNSPNDVYHDTITDYRVVFNFVQIPVGYNQYLSPRTYLTYKLGFNFFTTSTYQGFITANNDYTEVGYIYKSQFAPSVFRKFYTNHSISINRIFFRRIDLGLSFIFTKSHFFKETNNELYKKFDREVSQYFAVGLNLKYFIFQIDSKKI